MATDFDPKTASREIEVIKNDLHCNAIRISGLDTNRLMVATEIALKQGLEVWLTPTMWNKKQDQTLAYIEGVAESAEKLLLQEQTRASLYSDELHRRRCAGALARPAIYALGAI